MDLLVNIDVDDLDRAIGFYTTAFELSAGRRFGADGVELLGGSAPIYLLVKAAGSRAASVSSQLRSYDRHWTPVHLDIVVDDIDAAVERATAAGATPDNGALEQLRAKLALLSDPFGHGFCLVSCQPRLRWDCYRPIARLPRRGSLVCGWREGDLRSAMVRG
jgi:predicted enzyme related to lactoylglutathione lyase